MDIIDLLYAVPETGADPELIENAADEITRLRQQVATLTEQRDEEIARNRPLKALVKSLEDQRSSLMKRQNEWHHAIETLESERKANDLLTKELAKLAAQQDMAVKAL
jgi:uncharacterized coiled-coil DUF342 family protein